MKRAVQVVLPVPPSANRYWRTFRGQTKVSAEGELYKALVKELLAPQVAGLIAGPFRVRADVFRPEHPIVHFRGKAPGRDLDNNPKVLNDALQGALIVNDNQQFRMEWEHWDHEPGNPRVQLIVEEDDEPREPPRSWVLEPHLQAALSAAEAKLSALRAKLRTKEKEKRAARKAAKALDTPPPGSLPLKPPGRPRKLTKKLAKEWATPAYRPPNR